MNDEVEIPAWVLALPHTPEGIAARLTYERIERLRERERDGDELPEGWMAIRDKEGRIIAGLQGDMLWIIATGKIVTVPQHVASEEDMRAVERRLAGVESPVPLFGTEADPQARR